MKSLLPIAAAFVTFGCATASAQMPFRPILQMRSRIRIARIRMVGCRVPLLRCRLVLLFPRRAPKLVFLFLTRVILQRLFVLLPPLGLNLIQRTGCRLNNWGLHETRWRDDATPKIRYNRPTGIVRLRLNDGPPIHRARKTEHHHHRRIVHGTCIRSVTSATRGRKESGRGLRRRLPRAEVRFGSVPASANRPPLLCASGGAVRFPPVPPRAQLGERRRVQRRHRAGQFLEPLEGAARVPPIGNVALRRQAGRFHNADGSRHGQQSRRNGRRVLPARPVIVRQDDDVPAPEVVRPSRVQMLLPDPPGLQDATSPQPSRV